ncbi:hypothetical protein G9A89_009471 [Geosiphon pyriformis]|nr:hypothetical protein G9A89_009471 [Geosiphon pyriformis]
MANNNTWKIETINVRELNNLGKAEKILQWIKDKQFNFVVIAETKLTALKEKRVFFAYFEDNFEERNTSINQLLYSTIFEQQPPDFEYLNHQIYIWIAAHQLVENPFETEEKSYQTALIFDIFLSKSEHSTQTVTPKPMAQDPMQANILAALQDIQTALGQRNNTPLPLFRSNAQDPIK